MAHGVRHLAWAAAIALAACSQHSGPSAADPGTGSASGNSGDLTDARPTTKASERAFQSIYVPPAVGHGNFEICLSQEAEENGTKRVTVPAAAVFQSWGGLTGDLRKAGSLDADAATGPETPAEEYAVVLIQPVTLTASKPCVLSVARAVTHDGFKFNHDVVPVELHLSFQADGLSETAAGDISNNEPADPTLRDAYANGFINGTPVADIAQVRHLRQRDMG